MANSELILDSPAILAPQDNDITQNVTPSKTQDDQHTKHRNKLEKKYEQLITYNLMP